MNKTTKTYGLLFAATLALAGCGAESSGTSADEDTSAPPASASPAETPSVTPSEEPSPSESAAAEGGTYTNEDLTALVSSLTDAQGQPLTVVPAEQLDQALIQARTLAESATITPEECSALASENLQAPEGSTYAAGASQAAEEMTQTTITIFSVEDPSVMSDQLTQSQDAITECTEYDIEFEGETISSTIEALEVETNAETSFGAITTQTIGTGESQMIMAVSGVQGNLAVSAVKLGTEIPAEAQEELVQLVNDALAAAE
ncbi:hypothetical protein [Arthrobacter sp. CAN_A1]|uniref:hypothetical protein n=1 Tax=Arthrobacter sp. CAN_A1 TaxID=2787717 RepID=UPI0018CA466E